MNSPDIYEIQYIYILILYYVKRKDHNITSWVVLITVALVSRRKIMEDNDIITMIAITYELMIWMNADEHA